MSYFDAAFAAAFPPKAPPVPYTYPVYTRNVVLTTLQTTPYTMGIPGKRVPLVVRTVTAIGLILSYRFVLSIWTRIAPIRFVPPPMSLLPHSTLLTPGIDPHGPSTGRRPFDYYGDFGFIVEIDKTAIPFAKFDGIDVEVDQIEYKDSIDTHPHKRAGIHRFGNIKLSKGVIADTTLWDWIHEVMKGNISRKNGSIHILGDNKDATEPEITYNFYQAWPCKWTGLRMDGKGSGGMIEDLELAVDYIERAK